MGLMPPQIPNLNEFGYLPPGDYTASIAEVGVRFGTGSSCREQRWSRFLRFLEWVNGTNAFQTLEIGGSFLTSTSNPGDIDVALELRAVSVPLQSAVAILSRQATDRIKNDYGVQLVVKKFNSAPYTPHAASDFDFVNDHLLLFRVLIHDRRPKSLTQNVRQGTIGGNRCKTTADVKWKPNGYG
jgi:hypothetical protein